MNILIFNLGMDKNDAILSFTEDWVNQIAKHCDQVFVLTLRSGEFRVVPNVHVYDIGHQKGFSKLRLIFNFYYLLFKILWKKKIDGVFSHMNQLFSALAGPVLFIFRIKLITWYAHPSVTISLKIAHFFSKYMVASLDLAYPYKKNKLRVIGQGIDTTLFQKTTDKKEKIILFTGRISRVKKLEVLINAFKINEPVIHDFKLLIVGDPNGREGIKYKNELTDLVNQQGLASKVIFKTAVNRQQLPDIYSSAFMNINQTQTGSGDKVIWEGMACETITLVANQGLIETLGQYKDLCLYEYNNEIQLAEKMKEILLLPEDERLEIGRFLRNQVIELHSLEKLPGKLLKLFN